MRIEPRPLHHVPGIVIAVVAGLLKAIPTRTPVNDDYQHLAYATQIMGGDLPLRDFWDLNTTLQYVLSAASELIFGHRLLSEAILIFVSTAVAVFVVYRLLQQVTGSSLIAALVAALFIVAFPRAYAYPKWIVYAVAAHLWWTYVWWPSTSRAIAMGVWTAVAFYLRPDHGVCVAISVALAMAAAHGGFDRAALRRTAVAGAVALLLVGPYLVFAVVQLGPVDFVRTEATTLQDEYARTYTGLRWPLRTGKDLLRLKPAELYAPHMALRWKADASPDARAATLAKYGLTVVADEGPGVQEVRLSRQSLDSLRALIADPLIDDTGGVERAAAAFAMSRWPAWKRLLFQFPWLRVHLLPGIDLPPDAGAAATMMLHVVPLLLAVLLVVPSFRRLLPPAVTPRSLLLFAACAAIVNFALLREPYAVRVADVIVLPGILFGVLLAMLFRSGSSVARWPLRATAVLVLVLVGKSLATAGEFGPRVRWLTGEGQLAGAARVWREVGARLTATPPSRFWAGRGPITLRLADYARRCVAPSDRILTLWYAPEIYYDADRLMAGRHLYFFAAFRTLEGEQQRELEKVTRRPPRIVFTDRNNEGAAASFPGLLGFIERNYRMAASFEEDDDRYGILIRRDDPPPGIDRVTGWPCYSPAGPRLMARAAGGPLKRETVTRWFHDAAAGTP